MLWLLVFEDEGTKILRNVGRSFYQSAFCDIQKYLDLLVDNCPKVISGYRRDADEILRSSGILRIV
jgi:hypothetical protein